MAQSYGEQERPQPYDLDDQPGQGDHGRSEKHGVTDPTARSVPYDLDDQPGQGDHGRSEKHGVADPTARSVEGEYGSGTPGEYCSTANKEGEFISPYTQAGTTEEYNKRAYGGEGFEPHEKPDPPHQNRSVGSEGPTEAAGTGRAYDDFGEPKQSLYGGEDERPPKEDWKEHLKEKLVPQKNREEERQPREAGGDEEKKKGVMEKVKEMFHT